MVNLFVPSAGSKWLIEAPYLIAAAEQLDVSVTTVLLAYSYGDSSTNLIQPLIAIPVLAVLRIRFGEVAGYGAMITAICLVVSLVAMSVIPTDL
jgi:short-chain fatty acids transporter